MLEQYKWPSLAQDVAILALPDSPISGLDAILSAYSLSEAEFNDLLDVPLFQRYVRNATDELQSLGSRASDVYRARSLAQGVSEKLYKDFLAGLLKPTESLKFLDLLYKAAGVNDKATTQVAVQVNNAVSIPSPKGLKGDKFAHLEEATCGA